MTFTYNIKKRYIGECGLAALWVKRVSDGHEAVVVVEESVDINSPLDLNLTLDETKQVAAAFPPSSMGWGRAMSFVDEVC